MPEQRTPEQVALASAAATFADEKLAPLATLASEEARRAAIAASKEAGFFGMTQPKAYGGTEAGQVELVIAREAIASRNPPMAHAVFGPGPGVLGGCDEHLATHYLAPLMRGEKRAGFAFTEPDDAPKHTWAERDGDHLVIHGCKNYVTGGAHADFLNTLVHVDEQPALVVIDTRAPGVTMERTFRSLDGSEHAAFRFDRARVASTNIVGQPGEGMPRALRQIGDTRLAIAAECSGLAMWVLDFLTQHLTRPHASGTPLGAREGVRLRYADLRIKAFAVRSMLYRTARLAAAGENVVNEGIAVKVTATEGIGEIVDTAIQLVGGRALEQEHPLAILYQRVRAMRLAEGASDVLRLNLARGALDLGKGRI